MTKNHEATSTCWITLRRLSPGDRGKVLEELAELAKLHEVYLKAIEPVYGMDGEKVGTVSLEEGAWVAYNLSDIEVFRGSFSEACWALHSPGL